MIMKKNTALLFVIMSVLSCKTPQQSKTYPLSKTTQNSQNNAPQGIAETLVTPFKDTDNFPQSWFGTWSGMLDIYNAKGLQQSVPMTCEMSATDSLGRYKWHIIYGNDREKGLRAYFLRTIDASKGKYQCDEMNTIQMESYLLGNKLFCSYVVEGNAIISTYEKISDNKIIFEIIFGKNNPVSETGGQIVKGDTIPIVKTYPIVISQRAVLIKK